MCTFRNLQAVAGATLPEHLSGVLGGHEFILGEPGAGHVRAQALWPQHYAARV